MGLRGRWACRTDTAGGRAGGTGRRAATLATRRLPASTHTTQETLSPSQTESAHGDLVPRLECHPAGHRIPQADDPAPAAHPGHRVCQSPLRRLGLRKGCRGRRPPPHATSCRKPSSLRHGCFVPGPGEETRKQENTRRRATWHGCSKSVWSLREKTPPSENRALPPQGERTATLRAVLMAVTGHAGLKSSLVSGLPPVPGVADTPIASHAGGLLGAEGRSQAFALGKARCWTQTRIH